MILKLGMKHLGIELYKIFINHDPWLILTFSRQGPLRSPMYLNGNFFQMSFEGQNLQLIGKWTEFL